MPPAPLVGVGFKHVHATSIFEDTSYSGFLEVHAENYMGAGGMPHRLLERARASHPVSLHGVGLSVGGGALDQNHLARFAALVRRYEPFLVSEHLAWSSHGGRYFNDLLPMPYNEAMLGRVCENIDLIQHAIGRPLLLENPATYATFKSSELSEVDFIAQIAGRTGCQLLLDVNNVYVSAKNHGFSAADYLRRFPLNRVSEIHVGGHAQQMDDGEMLFIDSHDAPVAEAVSELFESVVAMGVRVPTLIEWDSNLPDWEGLRAQADMAVSHQAKACAEGR